MLYSRSHFCKKIVEWGSPKVHSVKQFTKSVNPPKILTIIEVHSTKSAEIACSHDCGFFTYLVDGPMTKRESSWNQRVNGALSQSMVFLYSTDKRNTKIYSQWNSALYNRLNTQDLSSSNVQMIMYYSSQEASIIITLARSFRQAGSFPINWTTAACMYES